MSFEWDINVPKDTKQDDPVEQELKLTFGVITKIEVEGAPGANKLVKVRLLRGKLFQLVPLPPDEWVRVGDFPASWRTHYPLDDEPYKLNFVGVSPGTSHDHNVTVRVEMLKKEVATPWDVLRDFVAILKRLMGI